MSGTRRICQICDNSLADGALHCPSCGASVPAGAPPEQGEVPDDVVFDRDGLRDELARALGQGFEVRRLVGRGGFGEVWEAWDVHLARPVAVKVLRPELSASVSFRARFRREARAVAQLRHPGIPPIYLVGESGPLVYFIMPLLDGITLKQALATEGRLSHAEVARILSEASAALRAAHRQGIVHRDLKPENVMLEGPERRVLLMDFGIAQLEDTDTQLTGAGLVLGSPVYMSPEQATGTRLDGRSDIYSLGVVGYHMLTGRPPFVAETARELLAKHVLTPPEPMETFPPVPEPLAGVVMRCLAKKPDERWQDADAFVAALSGEVGRFSPTALKRLSDADTVALAPVRPAVVRRRAQWTATALALGVIAAVAAFGWPLLQERRATARWQAARDTVVAVYQGVADSVYAVTAAFVRGAVPGRAAMAAQESVQVRADARLAAVAGAALADLTLWPATLRPDVEDVLSEVFGATLSGGPLALEASSDAGCRMERGSVLQLQDRARSDNCWFRVAASPPANDPAEFSLRFRLRAPRAATAGVGLAWCVSATSCRTLFLWAESRAVWGRVSPGAGLRQLQLGPRLVLGTADHELRLRTDLGRTVVWLDGREILRREDAAESGLLAQSGAMRVVVQNASVELPGQAPLMVVGTRR